MPDSQLWSVIQSWMDGQIVRVNQAQLAQAIGVNRQSLTQWKLGQARPSPESLRALRRVTRLDWDLLTDALLRDMGYTEEQEAGHGSPITRAGVSPAELEAQGDAALSQLPPEVQEAARAAREGLRPKRGPAPSRRRAAGENGD